MNVAAFYPYPKHLPKPEVKRLISLTEEISRKPNVDYEA